MGGRAEASAEIYDPATGTFTATGSMVEMRAFESMVVLLDGRVLLAGGLLGTGWSEVGKTAEVYDPVKGTFTLTGSMSIARDQAQAAMLPDGRVLIVGGSHERTGLGYGEIYDPKTGTFSKTGPLGTPRLLPTATTLQDGTVLIAGGTGPQDEILSSAELFNP
jgi:hypothetical protein